MKRILMASTLALLLLGAALAANVYKFTFQDVTYSDGRVGTVQVSVKTTKGGSVTVCDYYSSPNDLFLGEFQGTDNISTDAVIIRDYALAHFGDRTPQK
jgi:opacity protein-like surface antigen